MVKQLSWLFPAFNLYDTFQVSIDKMNGCGHINSTCLEHLPKKTKVTRYYVATKELLERQNASFIKVSGQMHSENFKRSPAFGFIGIILA